MPKVSVIIPTYNRADLVGDSIESVLRQSFLDFELIVVDDGSTDNTRSVVESFQDPRIRYIYQENQGVVAAQNTGVKACHGEYITVLGSDDVLLANALEKGVKVLDRSPEVAFSFGQTYLMDENKHVFDLFKPRPQKASYVRGGIEEIRYFLIHGNHIGPSMAMIRKSCFTEVGMFDPAFREGSEDFDLWVRLSKKFAVAYIADPLAKCRVHSDSITNNREIQEIENKHLLILERIYSDASVSALLAFEKAEAYYHLYWRLTRQASDKTTAKIFLIKICGLS